MASPGHNELNLKVMISVFLGDFGISKMMDATVDVASTCVGTPCYLSPEMCQDIPYTSKADVWVSGHFGKKLWTLRLQVM